MDLIALAVNEENASGGRIVTAPTNGAAGISPAVLYYALHYGPGMPDAPKERKDDVVVRFLLTAGAIGVLYKETSSGGLAVNVPECWPPSRLPVR